VFATFSTVREAVEKLSAAALKAFDASPRK
jgi:hypothetical protein